MINNVVLVGRLTKDMDLRYTGNGTAVATFTIAVPRTFKNEQGERETDFINCVIWRKAAENMANFTHKGSLVGVEGRIQTRNYENAEGRRIYVTEILVENFSLLESRNSQNNGDSGTFNQPNTNTYNYNQNANTSGNFGNNNTFNANAQNNNSFNANNRTRGDVNNAVSGINQSFSKPFISGETVDISDEDLPF